MVRLLEICCDQLFLNHLSIEIWMVYDLSNKQPFFLVEIQFKKLFLGCAFWGSWEYIPRGFPERGDLFLGKAKSISCNSLVNHVLHHWLSHSVPFNVLAGASQISQLGYVCICISIYIYIYIHLYIYISYVQIYI